MTGQQQAAPRWKDCAQVPSTVLPLAAGAIYVQAHFQESDKDEALRMIVHLRDSFANLVKKNDWMDEETKEIAIQKANSMINNIGYPDVTNDLKQLDKQYLGVSDKDSGARILDSEGFCPKTHFSAWHPRIRYLLRDYEEIGGLDAESWIPEAYEAVW